MSVQSLYQNISLIDASTHGKKRIKPLSSLSVVSDAHGMFVAGTEFQEAAKEFPIIFVVAEAPTEAKPAVVSPVAVLGLQRGDNLFVDAQGKWTGNYVPAFLRRLPFIVADIGEGRLGVCVDENSTQLSETEGEAMFDDKGGNVKEATPGTPVRVIGWSGTPDSGASFRAVKNAREAEKIAEEDLPLENVSLFDLVDALKEVLRLKALIEHHRTAKVHWCDQRDDRAIDMVDRQHAHHALARVQPVPLTDALRIGE